jgi:hypothetical protein
MASYFSNHSQSRFLANSNSQKSAEQSNTPPQPQRLRLSSSKHFSTSVSSDDKSLTKEKLSGNNENGNTVTVPVHPLRNTYVRSLRRTSPLCIIQFCISPDGCSGSDSSVRQEIRSRIMKRESRRFLLSALYASVCW